MDTFRIIKSVLIKSIMNSYLQPCAEPCADRRRRSSPSVASRHYAPYAADSHTHRVFFLSVCPGVCCFLQTGVCGAKPTLEVSGGQIPGPAVRAPSLRERGPGHGSCDLRPALCAVCWTRPVDWLPLLALGDQGVLLCIEPIIVMIMNDHIKALFTETI